jgi:hypothetical protein
MKEFVLIFRLSDDSDFTSSPEQMQEIANWLENIAARNKLADKGNRLSVHEAKTLKAGNVLTDGPFTEIKEFISGYTTVKAATLEEATELAKGNPILRMGGSVEVRGLL